MKNFSPLRRGFTLIELMIVVAIVAILLAVVLPSFRQQILRSHRVLARTAVMDMAGRQERVRAITTSYTTDAKALGYAKLPQPVGNDGESVYELTVELADNLHYTAVAKPVGGQKADATCYAFTIDENGARGNRDADGNKISDAACW